MSEIRQHRADWQGFRCDNFYPIKEAMFRETYEPVEES